MRKNILRSLTVEALAIPIGMATGILTARFLGPSDRGLLTLLLLLPRTVTIFGNVGVDTASIYLHGRERVPLGTLFWNGILYTIGLSALAAGVLWTWRVEILGSLVAQSNPLYLLIPILTIPFLFLLQMLGAFARARGDFSTYNRRTLLEKVLTLLGVGLIFAISNGTVIQCLLVFLAIPALISTWLVWDLRNHLRHGKPDQKVFRRTLTFGVKSYMQNLAQHIHNRVDVYLVALYLTNAELAFYSIGTSLAERILMIPNALGMVLYPTLVALPKAEAARLTARAARNTVLVGICTAIPVLLLGRWMIQLLYGTAYLDAVVPTYILASGVLFIGVTRILLRYFTSINQHHYNGIIVLGAAIVNVALNFVLIPRLGIRGAAISSLVTYTGQSMLALYVFSSLTGLSFLECVIPTRADVAHIVRIGKDFFSRGYWRPRPSEV